MDSIYIWIETTSFSIWLRESPSVFAFPTVLTLHTVGMAFLAGPSVAIALRILGAAPNLRLAPLRHLFPLMWAGFWLNATTGAALLIAYPTKALTNPLFYLKLALIVAAVTVVRTIRRRVLCPPAADSKTRPAIARRLAVLSLALWIATIFAGRWLAYTYSRLLTYADL